MDEHSPPLPSRTVPLGLAARQQSPGSGTPGSGGKGPDTSFFTVSRRANLTPSTSAEAEHKPLFQFLVALLILAFASAALILRAIILRRRFRNRLQAAMDAGLIPRQPAIPERKPEFYEPYVRGAEVGVKAWASVMPLSASELGSDDDQKSPAVQYRPSLAARLMEVLGHRTRSHGTTKASSDTNNTNNSHDTATSSSRPRQVQLVVLIAMPSEYPGIPLLDEGHIEGKGKAREAGVAEEGMPEVMLGVSSLRVG